MVGTDNATKQQKNTILFLKCYIIKFEQ